MTELITLKWADGAVFQWDTGSIRDAREAMRLQRKHGDPVEIIGDGPTANLLRKRYEAYRKALAEDKEYEMDVVGTASELSGIAREDLEKKLKDKEGQLKNRIREPMGRLWKRVK